MRIYCNISCKFDKLVFSEFFYRPTAWPPKSHRSDVDIRLHIDTICEDCIELGVQGLGVGQDIGDMNKNRNIYTITHRYEFIYKLSVNLRSDGDACCMFQVQSQSIQT